jgi:hypothetical protein
VDPVDASVWKVSAILNAAGLNTRAARQAAAEAASRESGGAASH